MEVLAPDIIYNDSDDSNDSNNEDISNKTLSKVLKLSNDFPILSPTTCNRREDTITARLDALNSIRDYNKLDLNY